MKKTKRAFSPIIKTWSLQWLKLFQRSILNFRIPNALASNLFEMTNNHVYFADHLPSLTEIKNKSIPEFRSRKNAALLYC